jgi:hypothetical protein
MTVRRYNLLFHLYAAHSKDRKLPDMIDVGIWVDMFVAQEKESWLGISTEHTAVFHT